MSNFSSKILKQKKVIISICLLFSILTGATIPCVAHGTVIGSFMCGFGGYYGCGIYGMFKITSYGAGKVIDAGVKNVENGIIFAVFDTTIGTTGFLAVMAQSFLNGIISLPACVGGAVDTDLASATYGQTVPGCVGGYTIGSSYTHIDPGQSDYNVAVAAGWPMARDLANMLIVLGFVIIGIATALRIREYEAKKLLAPLIIVALLVNFSLLICGLFIDGSNIVTKYFLAGGGFGPSFLKTLATQANLYSSGLGQDPTNPLNVLGQVIGLIFYNIMATIIFFLYFFLFIFRYMALWILVILSPLAFVCYVFPFTKKFWGMWWENFFQWCIIGIPGGFFLWLADQTLSRSLPAAGNTNIINPAVYFVPGLLLIIGFMFALKASAMGASMAISALKKGGKATGMAALQLSGRTQAGQKSQEWLKNAGARIQEATGFAPEGHAPQQRAARTAEARKQVDAMRTGTAGDKSRYEALAKNGQGAMGAEAAAAAFEHGDHGRIWGNDVNAMHQRATFAESFGHERSDLEKKEYRLAGENKKKVADMMTTNPGMSAAEAKSRVNKTQLATNLKAGMSAGELGRIDHNDISGAVDPRNADFVEENFTPHMIDLLQTSTNKNLTGSMKAHAAEMRRRAAVAINGNETTRLNKLADAMDRLPGGSGAGGGGAGPRPAGGGGAGGGGGYTHRPAGGGTPPPNHYSTLGVNQNATPTEIKKAYRQATKTAHPDAGGSHEAFVKIQQAYDAIRKEKGF